MATLSLPFGVLAQNTVLLETEAPVLTADYQALLPKDMRQSVDANETMKYLLQEFRSHHLYFNQIYFPIFTYIGNEVKAALKRSFFKNKKAFDKIYQKAVPQFKQAFARMTEPERKDYLRFFKSALDYAQNFDLQRERADLDRLGDRFLESKGHFNAFIYRRIAGKELAQKECVYWLQRFYDDLSGAVIEKTDRVECMYFLYAPSEDMPPGFVYANIYGGDANMLTIMELRGDNYELAIPPGHQIQYQTEESWGSESPVIVFLNSAVFVLTHYQDKSWLLVLQPGKPLAQIAMPDYAAQGFYWHSLAEASEGYWRVYDDRGDALFFKIDEKGQVKQAFAKVFHNTLAVLEHSDGSNQILHFGNRLFADMYSRLEAPIYGKSFTNAFTSYGLWLCDAQNIVYLDYRTEDALNAVMRELSFTASRPQAEGLDLLEDGRSVMVHYAAGKKELVRFQAYDQPLFRLPLPDDCRTVEQIISDENGVLSCVVYRNKNELFGCIDPTGKVTIAARYKRLMPWRSPDAGDTALYFRFSEDGTKDGVMNAAGKVLLRPRYTLWGEHWLNPSDGKVYLLASNEDNSKLGLLGMNDQIALPVEFGDVKHYPGVPLLFVAKESGSGQARYALYDARFKALTDFRFLPDEAMDTILVFDPETFAEIEQYLPVPAFYPDTLSRTVALNDGQKTWIYGFDGKARFSGTWQAASPLGSRFLAVQEGENVGLLDLRDGKIVLESRYADVKYMDSMPVLLAAKPNPTAGLPLRYALFSLDGKQRSDFEYALPVVFVEEFDPETYEEVTVGYEVPLEQCFLPANNALWLVKNNHQGLLHTETLQALIPFETNKLLPVCIDETAPCHFVVTNGPGKYALFDPQGKALTDFDYDAFSEYNPNEKCFIFIKNEKEVRIDKKGKRR